VALAAVATAAVAAEWPLSKTARAVAAGPLMFVVGGTCSRNLSPPGQPFTNDDGERTREKAVCKHRSAKATKEETKDERSRYYGTQGSDRGLIVACRMQDRYVEGSRLAGGAREQR